ncbi:MAG: hypothetical protein KGK30_08770 [Elusimicrobia bacterium]|nr:hypothetical protein [Elusimicrobiota bacterium]
MANNHGGKRRGAGRKKLPGDMLNRNVRLMAEQARLLRLWGDGNLSAGLRWIIDVAAPLVRRAEDGPVPPRSSG